MALCNHCRSRKVNRPRGLCWRCYYKPGVRDMYPTATGANKPGRGLNRGNGLVNIMLPTPPEPTGTLPGTPERLVVMQDRAKAGYALYHPDDLTPDLA